MDDAGGDAQRPGGGRNQQRVRFQVGGRPVASRELVLDQAVGGGGVRHPQQRLGQHHEGKPLPGGKRIGVEEIFDAAEAAGAAANGLDQAGGESINPLFGRVRARRLREQSRRDLLVGRCIRRAEQMFRIGVWGVAKQRIRDHDMVRLGL